MTELQKPTDLFKPLTITRYGTGSYDANGEWVIGSSSQLVINACVQPADDKDKEILDEGERTKQAIKIYADDILLTANEDTKKKADIVTFNLENYEVQKVRNYGVGILYYKAIAVRVEQC